MTICLGEWREDKSDTNGRRHQGWFDLYVSELYTFSHNLKRIASVPKPSYSALVALRQAHSLSQANLRPISNQATSSLSYGQPSKLPTPLPRHILAFFLRCSSSSLRTQSSPAPAKGHSFVHAHIRLSLSRSRVHIRDSKMGRVCRLEVWWVVVRKRSQRVRKWRDL